MSEETLFYLALEQAESERDAFLDEACALDPSLRRRVAELLDAHARPAGFLERPLTSSASAAIALGDQDMTMDTGAGPQAHDVPASHEAAGDGPGLRIGPYKLLEEIGGGGMGTVWMAEQQHPVRRRVALKLIKPGMDSSKVLARFDAERQALALMDHPNIAKVLDAGTTDTGRPYFVMELVAGVPITHYCDEHELTPRERIELLVPVCQAIQHAHQKGIIHRDIKPSNVLVAAYDGQPVPKVIDFGVAKAIGSALTEDTLFTGFGGIVGTLEYMSPEQAEFNALDIDTRSDVYSMGVVLYELLTGTTPLTRQQLKQTGITEALRLIREQDPPRPSARLSESMRAHSAISVQRRMEPARLARLVRGELDWIVMKALEKDRSRRYATANGMARDLERYLANQAVEACPPSLRYRTRKFLRRHWYGVLTAAALLLVMSAGIVGSTWQAVRALRAEAGERQARLTSESNFRLAREAVALGFTKVADSPELKAHGLEQLRKELLRNAGDFYAHFVSGQPADPDLRAEQGETFLRLAKITAETGDRAEAAVYAQSAFRIFDALSREFPDNADYVDGLASACSLSASQCLTDGRLTPAQHSLQHAVVLRRRLLARFPDNRDQKFRLASALNSLGQFFNWQIAASDKAESTLMEALALCEDLVHEQPDVPEYQNELAHILQSLSRMHGPRGRHDLALAYSQRALPLLENLSRKHPAAPEYQDRLVQTLTDMEISYHNLRQPEKALALYERARPVAEKLAQTHPDVPAYQARLGQLKVLYGGALSQVGEYRRAIAEVEEALKTPDSTIILYNAACAYSLATAHVRTDQKLAAQEREQLVEQYPQRAVELLVQAEQAGWFTGGSSLESLAHDPDFDTIRDREDFQQLMARVKSRAAEHR